MRRTALVWLAVALAAGPSSAATSPRVELWTMGPGDDPFSKFGHAAMCVLDERTPGGRCYNYGTADFTTPVPLTWGVLRGRARFWVSVTPRAAMLEAYRGWDRTLYRQVLPLPPEQARELARRLAHDARPENRTYTYHHFFDNCTTRLRDHVDAVTGGKLRAGADQPYGPTFRALVRQGFSSNLGLLAASELLVGRFLETRPTVWQAEFLPDVLREEVSRRLGAPYGIVYRRQAPLGSASPTAGGRAILVAALVLGALCAGLVATRRRALRRTGLVIGGVVLGLLALPIDFLAAASKLSELRANELLLVLLPTDFLVAFLDGARLRLYLAARLALLVPVAAASAASILVQPLWPPLALVTAIVAPLWLLERRGALAAARAEGATASVGSSTQPDEPRPARGS